MSGASALDGRNDEEDPPSNRIHVTLWGASGAARSAYLGALRLASGQDHLQYGRWEVQGVTRRAEEWMAEAARQLRAGHLPGAASVGDTLNVRVRGELPAPRWRRQIPRADTTRSTAFHVCTHECPGVDGADQDHATSSRAARPARTADGIMFLFDPELTGSENQESFESLLRQAGQPPDATPRIKRSPPALAVCVVNFDRPAAFRLAVDKLLLNQGEWPPRMPLILDRDAEEYFRHLCRKVGADTLPGVIRNSHLPRAEYSVASAVGFHVDADYQFRSADPFNHTGDHRELRGPARPINILQPLVRLAAASRRHLTR